jgi:ankyrin repeat protein
VLCPFQAGCTALQRAAAEGHLEVVKQLIKHGADVNRQDNVVSNYHAHNLGYDPAPVNKRVASHGNYSIGFGRTLI